MIVVTGLLPVYGWCYLVAFFSLDVSFCAYVHLFAISMRIYINTFVYSLSKL